MIKEGDLASLTGPLKGLFLLFIITLSLGFFIGINFVHFTTSGSPNGIIENYLGNENNDDAEVMKFKKSEHEMLNIIHTHLLSMSLIFFVIGLLVYACNIPPKLKTFLLIEPMLSVLVTFGSIYFLWLGNTWITYVIIISGALMTISFGISVLYIVLNILKPNPIRSSSV